MGLRVETSPGISSVVKDAAPTLGGELDTNGNDINIGTDNLTDGSDTLGFENLQASAEGSIVAIFDGGGSALTTGAQKVYIEAPHDGTITQASLVGDASGDLVIDIWVDTYANFPPTVADTITASAKPTLSSAQKSQDSTLTGWTKTFSEGDWFEFNIDSAVTITKATLTLRYTKTGV